MKKVDLTCPRCKAIMNVNKEKTEANCDYCGYKFLINKSESIEEAARRAREIAYAFTDGKNKANEESSKRKKREKRNKTILTIFAVFIAITTIVCISYYSKEFIDDPFVGVKVNFSGVDGNGTATISYEKVKNSDIVYKLSKSSNLEENEEIKLFVTSEKYRFKINEKTLIVTGLNKYINSLEEISGEVRNYINDKSHEYQKEKIEKGYSFSGSINSLKPYKIYLAIKDNGNYLFDIFEIKIKTKSGKVYSKYVVTEYKNVILTDLDEFKIRFDSMRNIGKTIAAGDLKIISAFEKNYAGFITGFYSINDIDNYIISEYDSNVKIYKE